VTELPPIEAHITEYRCHRRRCARGGTTTQAPLPDDLAGQFGPQLTALIAYLTVVCRLPRLVVQRLLEGALQIPMSLGRTQHAWEEASAAVAAPYDELQHALPDQPVLNGDETGHRTNGAKRWLWTLVAPTFIFYAMATSRGSDVLRGLLGATFNGILGSDRLPTYLAYGAARRQFCWAHFTRNLLSAQELATTASAKRFCREALTLQRQLFRVWHRFRGDPRARGAPLTRPQLMAKTLPIEQKLFALAERHVNAAAGDVANLARALFVHHPDFFTFVHEDGVDPTNNVAERALRTAVQWRKIMFGNRSARGRTRRRSAAHGDAHLSVATAQRPRVSDRRHSVPPSSSSRGVTAAEAAHPLNCYLHCHRRTEVNAQQSVVLARTPRCHRHQLAVPVLHRRSWQRNIELLFDIVYVSLAECAYPLRQQHSLG